MLNNDDDHILLEVNMSSHILKIPITDIVCWLLRITTVILGQKYLRVHVLGGAYSLVPNKRLPRLLNFGYD